MLTVCYAIISCYCWHFHNNIAPYITSTTNILWQWISHNCQSPFVKQPITIVFAMVAKRRTHRFDLNNNCQSPGDVTAIRAARLRTLFLKRLLNEDTEPAEVIESERQFLCATVNGVKELSKSGCLTLGMTSLCLVKYLLTGLWFITNSICSNRTTTRPLRILFMKTSRLIRRLSSNGSKLSWARSSVALYFQP